MWLRMSTCRFAQQAVDPPAHGARLLQRGDRLRMKVHALVCHAQADQGCDYRFGELAVQLPKEFHRFQKIAFRILKEPCPALALGEVRDGNGGFGGLLAELLDRQFDQPRGHRDGFRELAVIEPVAQRQLRFQTSDKGLDLRPGVFKEFVLDGRGSRHGQGGIDRVGLLGGGGTEARGRNQHTQPAWPGGTANSEN